MTIVVFIRMLSQSLRMTQRRIRVLVYVIKKSINPKHSNVGKASGGEKEISDSSIKTIDDAVRHLIKDSKSLIGTKDNSEDVIASLSEFTSSYRAYKDSINNPPEIIKTNIGFRETVPWPSFNSYFSISESLGLVKKTEQLDIKQNKYEQNREDVPRSEGSSDTE